MRLFLFLLNFPFTLAGVVAMLLSGLYSFTLIKNPIALVFKVRSFWWAFGYFKYARAMTVGHIILMGPKVLKNDLEHEIIHVRQWERYPVIYPFLYLHEPFKKDYRQNRFEDEAYRLSKSIYRK